MGNRDNSPEELPHPRTFKRCGYKRRVCASKHGADLFNLPSRFGDIIVCARDRSHGHRLAGPK
jgi:hypothetical protein